MYNYQQELMNIRNRIDNQLLNSQNLQQNQAPITQNFQITPQPNTNELYSKIVETKDEVKNTLVITTGVFVNADYSKLWIKDVTGSIREFDTSEVIELDEKDKEILALKEEIQKLKGEKDEQSNVTDDIKSSSSKRSKGISNAK